MKPKHPLAITFGLALFIFCGVAFWLHSTNVITIAQSGIVDQTYPDWLMRLSTIVLCLGFLALLGLLFLPLDRSRHALPVWFRAHWFVPALFLLWMGTGIHFPPAPRAHRKLFNFSPAPKALRAFPVASRRAFC